MIAVVVSIPQWLVPTVAAWSAKPTAAVPKPPANPAFNWPVAVVKLCTVASVAIITFVEGPTDDILTGEAGQNYGLTRSEGTFLQSVGQSLRNDLPTLPCMQGICLLLCAAGY
jgi:hypothetical protein